jgi:superfamily I DNA/RNA helicase
MPKQNFFVNEDELDDFQVQLLQKRVVSGGGRGNGEGGGSGSGGGGMIVTGCAGSGKSILALWKAKQIQKLGHSYIFIVFTKALHRYMSDGIQAIGLNDANFVYHYQWKAMGFPSADFIIVDEVQDFTREEISQFKNAAKQAFLFWGDSDQSIYKNLKPTKTIKEIAAEASILAEKLVFNHRLPRKIARFAAQLIGDEELVSRCKKEGEDLPKVLHLSKLEEQLDVAMQQIKNRQITDAAILFCDNDMVKKAYNYLTNNGYSIEANFRDKQDFKGDVSDLDFSSDNPKLMTYHSAKGLQFEAVFLPECNPPEKMGIEPLYVAITRSYRYLYVMYSSQMSSCFNSIPTELYMTTLENDKIEL